MKLKNLSGIFSGAMQGRQIFSSNLMSVIRIIVIVSVGPFLILLVNHEAAYVRDFGLFWRNALPISLVAIAIYGLAGRVMVSLWLASGLVLIIFVVNHIKIKNMNAPLMPADLDLQSQVLQNVAFFSRYSSHGALLSAGLITFVIVLIILWRVEPLDKHSSRITRGVYFILAVTLIWTMFQGVGPWKRTYSDDALPGYQQWNPVAAVGQVGLMASLVKMGQESKVKIPVPDKSVILNYADEHRTDLQSRIARKVPNELPDIVVVQSEAFFDPSIMKGIESGEFVPNFERVASAGISGELNAPAYGGGTIRTEFETLTGYPIQAFPSIVYPYYGLAARWMPSIPRRLRRFGYSTTFFHPFLSEFWNRYDVIPKLGFQKSYYEKDFGQVERAGAYVSDGALFDFVLKHLDDGPGPKYMMAITMENHGPWDGDVGYLSDRLDGRPLPRGLSAAGVQEMTYYLSHLVNGDQALGDFAKKLLSRKRWTILLFYGDHLPALSSAFKDLGFDNGGQHGAQRTRYMLVSNRPMQARHLDLNSYELPGLLFDALGLPEDGYLAFNASVRQTWEDSGFKHGPELGQVLFNAAPLEVRCRRKMNMDAGCKRKSSSDTASSSSVTAH